MSNLATKGLPDKRDYLSIKELKLPVLDNWKIQTNLNNNSLDIFNAILVHENNGTAISITSQKPHAYIKGLEKLSEYYNEKLVRNLKATEIILTSKKKETKIFKGINANYEYYDSKQTSTGIENEIVSINFIYQNYAYTIFYVTIPEAEQVINGIELK